MNQLSLHISPESYEQDGRFGKIYIQLDDYAFPGKGWTDFGSDLIYWWMESLIKLLTKTEKKVRCSFMDGNYRFDLEISNDKKFWKIFLIREYADSEEIKAEGQVDPTQTTEAIATAARFFEESEKNKGDIKSANNYNQRVQLMLNALQKNFKTSK